MSYRPTANDNAAMPVVASPYTADEFRQRSDRMPTARIGLPASLVHDLRSPMATVKMAISNLLTESAGSAAFLELLGLADRNINLALARVDSFLDESRGDPRLRLRLDVEFVALTTLARETLEDLKAVVGQNLVLAGDEDIKGYWDADGLRRVIENLVVNAGKYGEPGGRITLTIKQSATQTRLAVHNRGTPIAAQDQHAIFDPFFRTASANRGPSKGWGLGLTLVRGVAEAMGGDVEITSSLAEGTTFTLIIPNDARRPS